MSKPSIRTGSDSSSSASCSAARASTRCWRRRSVRSLSWASARRALRSASSRSRRLSPRSATRTSTGPPRRVDSASASRLDAVGERRADDDQPGHRRHRGVVLGDELLGHLRLTALALVRQVEALALGEHAVADLEHLGVRPRPLDGDRDQVGRLERLARDAAALHQRPNRLQPVAVGRRALELLGGRRLVHLALEVALDVAVTPRQEVHDRLDVAPVLLAVDVADAGRLAALDVVVEAGHARAPPRLRALAGAVLEELAQQVEGLAHPPGAGERPEVHAPRAVALAGEVDARELLVEADPDVRIRLVVAQPDVEPRPVALDELLLGEQRLGLGLGDEEVDRRDPADEVERRRGAGPRSARRRACESTSPCRRRARRRRRP